MNSRKYQQLGGVIAVTMSIFIHENVRATLFTPQLGLKTASQIVKSHPLMAFITGAAVGEIIKPISRINNWLDKENSRDSRSSSRHIDDDITRNRPLSLRGRCYHYLFDNRNL